ncbi:MAG: N-acetylmuramoyl-L-alanine amidase [Ruminococcaceae bacterium]|nr:N-acetylmuramoyl-L-alanine amidase [Oscillospiraceae bacterium]
MQIPLGSYGSDTLVLFNLFGDNWSLRFLCGGFGCRTFYSEEVKMKKIFAFVLVAIVVVVACVYISDYDFNLNIDDILHESSKVSSVIENPKAVVCIDAGHGFGDIGCESEFLSGVEAEVTIKIAKLLKTELEKRNIMVILTHDGEKFPTCKQIISTANKYNIEYDNTRLIENNVFSAYERAIYACGVNKTNQIDLLVSLHINSIINHPELSQYELYYYENNPFADRVAQLCNSLSVNFDNYTKTTASNDADAYTVTRYCDFPSLLIEMGYATNKDDAKKLNSNIWRLEFVKILADEINTWVDE